MAFFETYLGHMPLLPSDDAIYRRAAATAEQLSGRHRVSAGRIRADARIGSLSGPTADVDVESVRKRTAK